MKLLIVCILVISLLSVSSGWKRWRSYGSCIDCRKRVVPPGHYYSDGCNRCRCTQWGPRRAWCTLMWCKWNKCYKHPGSNRYSTPG